MKPEAVVIIGTGRLACRCLEASLAHGKNIVCVEPEKQDFSPLAALCRKHGVTYHLMVENENLSRFFLSISQPTLVISAYNSFVFPRKVLENGQLNIVNFHNSLLPRHRGRNAPTWSIFERDPITGVTWHQVRAEVDTGDVICQRQIEIPEDITALELTLRTLDLGAQLFRDILPSLLDGSYSHVPISRNDKESFHRSTDVPNDGVLDLGWSIDRAYAFLRALDYGKFKVLPAPKIRLLGTDLSVESYRMQRSKLGQRSGKSVAFDNKQLVLSSGDDQLLISCA